MCLYTNNEIETSDKKITCYKVLAYRADTHEYLTPYQGQIISDEIIRGKKLMYAEPLNPTYPLLRNFVHQQFYKSVCDIGFVHCFIRLSDAIKEDEFWCKQECKGKNVLVKIFECEVPNNTEYIIGDFVYSVDNGGEHCCGSIAARQLKFVREIKEF